MVSLNLQPGTFTFTHDSLTLYYTIKPEPAKPISSTPVIIQPPGWGIGIAIYRSAFRSLEDDFQIIYLEARGTDRSERPNEPDDMSSRMMAADLEALRVHLGLSNVNVIGHSGGATIALSHAILYPQKQSKVVLLNGYLLGQPPSSNALEFRANIIRIRNEMQPTTDEAFRRFFLCIVTGYFYDPIAGVPEFDAALTNTPSLWAHASWHGADSRSGWRQADDLHRVEAQTLVLVGRQDQICDVDTAEVIHQGIKGSQLKIIEECGHFPWIEKPSEFYECIREFLKD